jgi:sulfite reductase beta subunit-like hemoprotein
MQRKMYQELASLVDAIANCQERNNTEWAKRHEARAYYLIKNYGPSGSGIDSGTSLKLSECKPDRLVLFTEFHHMDENGTYDGWTQHRVTVTPVWRMGSILNSQDRTVTR